MTNESWAAAKAEEITNYVEFSAAFESRPFSYLCRDMLRKEITAALLEARGQKEVDDLISKGEHACQTGDCSHEKQSQCDAELKARGQSAQGFEEAWSNLKAPQNETVTSKWYFKQGYLAGAQSRSLRLPDFSSVNEAAISTAAMRDYGSNRKDYKQKYLTNHDFYMAVTSAFQRGAKFVLERLNTTKKPDEKESV